jgi:hypothetical protein
LYMYREYTVWVCFWTCQFPWRHRALVGPPVISFVHHHQWKSVNNGGGQNAWDILSARRCRHFFYFSKRTEAHTVFFYF